MLKKNNNLGYFRFKKTGNEYLLTNDAGDFLFLKEKDFNSFLDDNLDKDKEPYLSLKEKNFVKDEMDLASCIDKYRSKNKFLFGGPSLHIIVVTQRCNHCCVYCHASAQSMDKEGLDMDKETAKQVVDKIFQTTSHFVAIEFQGGEPLVNWDIIKFIIEYAKKKNKQAKKDLQLRLVSNFSLMTEEKFQYLIKNKVSFCISIDGPEKVHNKNRPMVGGNSYKHAIKWAKKFNDLYPKLKKKKYIFKMGLAVTTSRFSLPYYKEIIDKYIKLGFTGVYLRPLNPFGFTKKHFKQIGYTVDEYMEFYKNALSYIIQLNLKGKEVTEKMAVTFLTKILTDGDPNHLDFRSPCGAGIGQLAYNYNGNVYTCDEGRMMSMMGDESFCLGNVTENSYQEIVGSPVTRTMCTASCLDGLAGCSDCVYKPYCGVCPIYNYSEQGNIFGQMPDNERCKINKATLDFLFEKLKDEKTRLIFEKWVK